MRKVLTLTLMLAVVLGAQYATWRSRSPVEVTHLLLAGSAVQRFQPAAEPAGVVIVAHGFAGSKELMRPWGYALARQGYETYLYDQPGHGDSTSRLQGQFGGPQLTENLRAIIDELIASGRAQPGRIGLVGHSMGGGTVVGTALTDDRVRATVILSSSHRDGLPADRPVNLLALAAERDPGFMVHAVQALARSTNGGNGELGKRYGRFEDGTAREADVVEGLNHITIIYDQQVMQRSADWLHAALGTTAPAPVPPLRWFWVLIGLAAGLGAVLTVGAMLAPGVDSRGRTAGQARLGFVAGLVTLAVASLSAVMACVYLRLPWTGLAVIDYLLPYFLVMATVLMTLRLLWPRDFSFPITLPGQAVIPLSLRGVGVFLAFVGAIGPVVQMNLSSFIPTPARVLPMLVLAVGLWLYLVQEEGLKRAVANEHGPGLAFLLGVAGKLIIAGTWLGSMALPNPNAFLPITIPVALSLLLVLEFIGLVLSRWRYPAVGVATFSALVLAWSMAVSFPLV